MTNRADQLHDRTPVSIVGGDSRPPPHDDRTVDLVALSSLDPVRWVTWQEQNGDIFAHSFVLARRGLHTQVKIPLDLISGWWYEAKKYFEKNID